MNWSRKCFRIYTKIVGLQVSSTYSIFIHRLPSPHENSKSNESIMEDLSKLAIEYQKLIGIHQLYH